MLLRLGARSHVPSRYDAVIVGPLLNNDVVMAEFLAHEGLECLVVRSAQAGLPDLTKLPAKLRHFSPERIRIASSPMEFLHIFRQAKCIITYSGVIYSYLRHLWLLLPIFPFPPIINIPTGSDITELAVQKNLRGFFYRQVLRRSAFTVVPAYPNAIETIKQIRLRNYMFLKYPYLLPERVDRPSAQGDKIVYLHASNLDWGHVDNKPGRNSTKGNDRFLRAFAAAASDGAPVRCRILDRGPDRLAARQLIEQLGASRFFEWHEPVAQSKLPTLMAEADVVVDQFDTGGLGAIAMEAMAQGKPVMTYLDPLCASLVYEQAPPIVNCRTEDEIGHAIRTNLDREALRRRGAETERWVRKNHGLGHDFSEFLLRFCVAARVEWPRPVRA